MLLVDTAVTNESHCSYSDLFRTFRCSDWLLHIQFVLKVLQDKAFLAEKDYLFGYELYMCTLHLDKH
jgi:hypothetical protein